MTSPEIELMSCWEFQSLMNLVMVSFDLKTSCIFNSIISVTCITCVTIDLDMKMIAFVRVGINDEIAP